MDARKLRIVFMGTPEFAVPSLEALAQNGYNVVGVVTTPDRQAGRGLHMQQCDVKQAAIRLGIDVILQPEKLRDEIFLKSLRSLEPDLGIVIAFRMLPEVVWSMPRYGTFNLHASLLPQYRGAAPINWAIINGEKETGVTTFLLNHEIDKGAVIGQVRESIRDDDNIGTLYNRLMNIGKDLVLSTVDKIASGSYSRIEQPQSDDNLHPAPKIFRDDCRLDFACEGERIVNLVRGLSPYPAAWFDLVDKDGNATTVKVYEARFIPDHTTTPGSIYTDGKCSIIIGCKDGSISISDLQIAGKKRMSAHDLLLGFRNIGSYVAR